MKTLILLRGWNGHRKGAVVHETNNVAHSLIESGVAEAHSFTKPPKDKMVDKKSRNIKLK
tara:strand:- start:818 stop:997 length:180 start_codon:yes stop_codon:yes gene_type:complete